MLTPERFSRRLVLNVQSGWYVRNRAAQDEVGQRRAQADFVLWFLPHLETRTIPDVVID